MTEDEAKKKWCPFVRFHNSDNRSGTMASGVMCIGSECMAWRREFKHADSGSRTRDNGFCGLAGTP